MQDPSQNPILHFAPLEGFTDHLYREFISMHYPKWDYLWTDFLRLPSEGPLKAKMIKEHAGAAYFSSQKVKDKTVFQILTSLRSAKEDHFKLLSDSEIPWLDLNLGCPSKKVVLHGGGSGLLNDLTSLQAIAARMRKLFQKKLTAKIRLGVSDDSNFLEVIHILQNEGFDGITIHPRTTKQMYTGEASWRHFEIAAKNCTLPFILSGDIRSYLQLETLQKKIPSASFMIGRKALGNPNFSSSENSTIQETATYILNFMFFLKESGLEEFKILKRCKAIIPYQSEIEGMQKRELLLSQTSLEFKNKLTPYASGE